MVKHRKRFPGHIVQFPQMMFLNKNETSICQEWHRSNQLHHPRAGGWPWCFLQALQVLVTKFKSSALACFLGKPEMWKPFFRDEKYRDFQFFLQIQEEMLRFLIHDSCSWAFCKTVSCYEKLPCIASYSNTASSSLVTPLPYFIWYVGESCSTY